MQDKPKLESGVEENAETEFVQAVTLLGELGPVGSAAARSLMIIDSHIATVREAGEQAFGDLTARVERMVRDAPEIFARLNGNPLTAANIPLVQRVFRRNRIDVDETGQTHEIQA